MDGSTREKASACRTAPHQPPDLNTTALVASGIQQMDAFVQRVKSLTASDASRLLAKAAKLKARLANVSRTLMASTAHRTTLLPIPLVQLYRKNATVACSMVLPHTVSVRQASGSTMALDHASLLPLAKEVSSTGEAAYARATRRS